MLQMRSVFRAIAAGIVFAGSASAQVTELEFFVDLDVSETWFWNGMGDPSDFDNFDFVRDESLELQGGIELLPLDLSVQGGEFFNSDDPFLIDTISSAGLDASGSLSSGGQLALDVFQSVGIQSRFGPSFSQSALVQTTFTISEPSEYRMELTDYGAHPDFGTWSVVLTDESGTVFVFDRDNVFNGFVREGVLPAGEYTLLSYTSGTASASFRIDIVPAPGTGALAIMSSVVLVRRRRA